MLIIDTNRPMAQIVTTLKKYTKAKVAPVMSSNAGRLWIHVSNVPFGGLSWIDVCKKENLSLLAQ